jgi:carbon monoxide dehydrogenase subunit G
MKLELNKRLDLPVPSGVAWEFLHRIESVAACMPGARITGQIDPTHYAGTLSVRLGPVTMNFGGKIEILAMDESTRKIRVMAKGTDSGGSSTAEIDLTAHVEEAGEKATQIVGTSNISINGKAATFGARLLGAVSDQLTGQFYGNLVKQIEAANRTQMAEAKAAGEAGLQVLLATAPIPPPEPTNLNALALIWAVIVVLVRRLFGVKPAS